VSADWPVLYSFRRCPYAMRARMALSYSDITVELREVVLREMPQELLDCSPKGTVPVLVLPDGRVIDESRDIMAWALARHDPHHWLPQDAGQQRVTRQLLDANDGPFKQDLDHYKYAVRYPEHPPAYYRAGGERFLGELEHRLGVQDWLTGHAMQIADVAVFPFVRQFANVDRDWFDRAPYPCLQAWLERLVASKLFTGCMRKYPQWQAGDAVTLFP
jgi:glutathione S-transferase